MRVFKFKKLWYMFLIDLIWKLYKLSIWNVKMLGFFLVSVSFKYFFFYYDWFFEDNFFLSRFCMYWFWGVFLILLIFWVENFINDFIICVISLWIDWISLVGKFMYKNIIYMKMGIFCMNNFIYFFWWKLK